jgi:hypothetical protein
MISFRYFWLLPNFASAHGYVHKFEIDGTTYLGYNPFLDKFLVQEEVSRIQWSFPDQKYAGTGPVLNVSSPDITCRKNAVPPRITAKARAGSMIKFRWTPYYPAHKGAVLTYMGLLKQPTTIPQEVDFFKISEGGYVPRTKTWATDDLINNNNSWIAQIPSDIAPGRYILRHEIVSLHFASNKTAYHPPSAEHGPPPGAQFYPVCASVEVIGSGFTTPSGVKFPGGYHPDDSGLRVNSSGRVDNYIPPGPPLYKGNFLAPEGPKPTVSDTGAMNDFYNYMDLAFTAFYTGYVRGINLHDRARALARHNGSEQCATRSLFSGILKSMKEELGGIQDPVSQCAP